MKLDSPVVITSDTMEADTSGKVVVFRGDVAAKGDFVLCSDELTMHYSDKDEVREIVATGNVLIVSGNKTATATKAVYERAGRTVVLTGRPVVRQCADTVTGARITINLEDDSSVVESSKGGRVRAVIMPEKDCPEEAAGAAGTESDKSGEDICRGAR
ncbi:MAG: lipopolysaccharide transport periplasmic protein LptA [Thermodesulfobacteriota bacterium]